MIFDNLENLHIYKGRHPNLDTAIDYIDSHDLASLDFGSYKVDGDLVYFFVQENTTNTHASQEFEYHESYIDLHFLRKGRELVKFGMEFEKQCQPYDAARDFASATCNYTVDFELDSGYFALFMPGELHQPNLRVNGCEKVEKCVFKVFLD
ncbi:YhcH/YjgK/YiaL family protein [Streptococcus gallinaceus]|uniref:YhcH/YjgK/YiaL family protein n=1 Tax=Streptococcus gallinaceus TaxID=165758 RepID=A0ABV2JLK0_9STRE|nr:YhcH/YjgK/YiaL family protein [Streptococcus gallinaceus]MCP1638701.1 YhcH/YjgK/YiaL family protein [Streptococcus gallinaceus]MCP1769212.1 YhcH/YjgK/YiaL family protein [Streptococcus gallinaceus]